MSSSNVSNQLPDKSNSSVPVSTASTNSSKSKSVTFSNRPTTDRGRTNTKSKTDTLRPGYVALPLTSYVNAPSTIRTPTSKSTPRIQTTNSNRNSTSTLHSPTKSSASRQINTKSKAN
jgi:hypothetical protein